MNINAPISTEEAARLFHERLRREQEQSKIADAERAVQAEALHNRSIERGREWAAREAKLSDLERLKRLRDENTPSRDDKIKLALTKGMLSMYGPAKCLDWDGFVTGALEVLEVLQAASPAR